MSSLHSPPTDPYIGGLADLAKNADVFPYSDIPGFPKSTVAGHVGRLDCFPSQLYSQSYITKG